MKNYPLTTPIQKIGKSSLAVIIPGPVVQDLQLEKGDIMRITTTKKCIIYERLK